ncbi:hypothetical protein Mpsy_0675 [Methanolobus psychrophilus R15]|nr:hypothetical protein Mpsy_0675 [Methanolobus psychrophilus R15]
MNIRYVLIMSAFFAECNKKKYTVVAFARRGQVEDYEHLRYIATIDA